MAMKKVESGEKEGEMALREIELKERRGQCSYCKKGNFNRMEFINHYLQYHKKEYEELKGKLIKKAEEHRSIKNKDRDTQKSMVIGEIIDCVGPVKHNSFDKPGFEFMYVIQKIKSSEEARKNEGTEFLYRFTYITIFTSLKSNGWQRYAQNAGQTTLTVDEYAFKVLMDKLNAKNW
ncbi:MAG: hypothetical protein KJ955_04815 [Nanoarchaeota archaeon]|nr:hypothetical protein [Nanoarchaeota archaeon]